MKNDLDMELCEAEIELENALQAYEVYKVGEYDRALDEYDTVPCLVCGKLPADCSAFRMSTSPIRRLTRKEGSLGVGGDENLRD